ncbi:alkaline phosphatase [Chamaesiphon sp. GL140_3_metabinner_50]|uniref:alkaline phosphatase n=1 Tax=Chamaesiphon sp. GL140_3_metabinner_50 TaxID=2970812 RepID=UPI003458F3E4
MIGDGMGWEIARAAAIQKGINGGNSGKTLKDFYAQGRGTRLNMQTLQGYALSTTYGTTVAGSDGKYSSNNSALDDSQKLTGASVVRPNFKFDPKFNPGQHGKNSPDSANPATGNLVGYDPIKGGANPWTLGTDREYIKASYPDSANTATTLYTGVKSYNNAIAVDIYERPLTTILKTAAIEGKSTGLVTSVPIDHATPGAASANVNRRNKYDINAPGATPLDNILQQQLRIYQPTVLLGGGHPLSNVKEPLPTGIEPVHTYISEATYRELSTKPNSNIYKYTFLERGANAAQKLAQTAASIDPNRGQRLLGIYGARGQAGNLPVSSANGDYSTTGFDLGKVHSTRGLQPDTTRPLSKNETDAQFTRRERNENPTLNELTTAALNVLGKDPEGFWLMVEGGDIDWAAHDNNLDNLIGTTLDFDRTVGMVIDWIKAHGGWERNQLIVTADHDHYFTLNDDFPALLRRQGAERLTAINTATEAGHYWGSQPVVVKDAAGKELSETGKYGWGNHSNRPVPVYYQGYAANVLTKSIGRGFKLYDNDVPGIPGLTDQIHIYQTQLAAVKTPVNRSIK